MTESWKLDDTGDLVLEDNGYGTLTPVIIDGVERTAQAVRLRLGTNLGEDALHPDTGIPFSEFIGIFDEAFIEGVCLAQLAQDPDIARVTAIEVTLDADRRRQRSADVFLRVVGQDGSETAVEGGLL